MTWQPVDCHAHTTFSDGQLSVDQLIEHVTARGVLPSVADHVSRDVERAIDSVEVLRTYLDTLEAHDVRRGGEFCWHDNLWRELPADIVGRFTHRIGSLHAIRLSNGTLVRAFTRRFPEGLTHEAYMRGHLASLEQLAAEMPVDILAHPTLVNLSLRDADPETLWSEEHETRMVDAMYNARIAFEISNRYRPHERLVKRAVERGVRISLGSDGHTAAQVGDIAWPLELARSLGVSDDSLYDPLRHGSKTLAG